MNVTQDTHDDRLKVIYPEGGKRFLLHWWTEGDRAHLVISPTQQSLYTVARRVFHESPDAKIKALLEVEIVGPPERFHALAEQIAVAQRVQDFQNEIASRMAEALKAEKPLPPPFSKCLDYDPTDEAAGKDPIQREQMLSDKTFREMHYECKHCVYQVCVSMAPEELYMHYHAGWSLVSPRKDFVDPKRVVSRAEPARGAKDLWFAYEDFGHHSRGVVLEEVDESDRGLIRYSGRNGIQEPTYLSSSLMFFFLRLREMDQKPMRAILESEAEAARKRAVDMDSVRRRRREEEVEERVKQVLGFFRT